MFFPIPPRRKSVSAFAALACFSLFSQSSVAGLEEDQGEPLSKYVFNQFRDICLEHSFEEAGRILENDSRYETYGESDIDGETWVEDTGVDPAYDVRITLRGGQNRCQIATWTDAEPLYVPLIRRFHTHTRAPMNAFTENEDNIVEKRIFRHVTDRQIVPGQIVEIIKFDDGGITINRTKRDPMLLHNPRAEWRVEDAETDGFGKLPVATASMRKHKVEIYNVAGEYALVFNPAFYEFFSGDKRYFKAQGDIQVDGVQLKAYGDCLENGENCEKNGDWHRLDLDRESLEQILQGETLHFYAKTTIGEFLEVRFPLTGMQEALAKVDNDEKIRRLAAMRSQGELMKPVIEGDLEGVKAQIESGADPDQLVGQQKIPLVVLAAVEGQMEIARYLIEQGADIDRGYPDHGAVRTSDPDMTSALHHAVRYSEGVEQTKLWLGLGADTEARNPDGRTPLMMVRHYQDNLDKFEALEAAGADLHARDDKGRTAMHSFVRRSGPSQADELAWLHRNGLSLDVPDADGNTPLMLAIRSYSMKEAEWLIEEGADPWITNDEGQNALDVALETRRGVDDEFLWGPETKKAYKRDLTTIIDHFRRIR